MKDSSVVHTGRGWAEPFLNPTPHYFVASGIRSICGKSFISIALKPDTAFTKSLNVISPCEDCYEVVHAVMHPDNTRSIWEFDGEKLIQKRGRKA